MTLYLRFDGTPSGGVQSVSPAFLSPLIDWEFRCPDDRGEREGRDANAQRPTNTGARTRAIKCAAIPPNQPSSVPRRVIKCKDMSIGGKKKQESEESVLIDDIPPVTAIFDEWQERLIPMYMAITRIFSRQAYC